MKIDRKTLVKKTTRILPPFEMPLPPVLYNNIFPKDICSIFAMGLGVKVLKEKEEKKREKEKGRNQREFKK